MFSTNRYGLTGMSPAARQVWAFVMAAVGLFIFCALYSYYQGDPSWLRLATHDEPIRNWCGTVGAQLAVTCVYLLGDAAFSLVVLFLTLSYRFARAEVLWSGDRPRLCMLFTIPLLTASVMQYHGLPSYVGVVPGGYCAYMIMKPLYACFDRFGAGLALYTLVGVCTVMTTRLVFVQHLQGALSWIIRRARLVHQTMVDHQPLVMMYRIICMLLAYAWAPLRAIFLFFKQLLNGSLFADLEEGDAVSDGDTSCGTPGGSSSYTIPEHTYSSDSIPDARREREPTSYASEKRAPSAALEGQNFEAYEDDEDEDERIAREVLNWNPDTSSQYDQELPEAATHPYDLEAYTLPGRSLFSYDAASHTTSQQGQELADRARMLEEKLDLFGVSGSVISIKYGPVVTLFEYEPTPETKISKILSLEDDLALALSATSIRIIAPIPGKSVVGFEVANEKRESVSFAKLIHAPLYDMFDGELPLVLGEDTVGRPVIADLAAMPHLLIAGSTGSGKSVALNAMLVGLLCKLTPSDVRLVLIDPKRLEFSSYADIGHLLFPIVTDVRYVPRVFRWVVTHMEERYERMAQEGVRSFADYNDLAADPESGLEPFARIVIVIDELADLMMTVGREVEDLITRIAQMARAAGIHMIVATQRPSVDVITGLIKVNFPSRLSLRVTSKVDSRTILDCAGADRLLGAGDMLFFDSTSAALRRVHGAYIASEEIERVVHHIRTQCAPDYQELPHEETGDGALAQEDVQLYKEVEAFVKEVDEISISLLQRKFSIGYNRSARIVTALEARGVIMPSEGGKMRKVVR